MIIYLSSFLFSAAVSAITIGRTDAVYPSIESTKLGKKTIKFRALDQDIHLRLEPTGDVITDDFPILNGAHENFDHFTKINDPKSKRKLYKDKKMGAALYVDDEGPVIVHGVINSQLRTEPHHSENLNKNGKVAHRVNELPKTENPYVVHKVIYESLKNDLNEETRLLRSSYCIEVSLLLDSDFTAYFENLSSMETYLSKTMTAVQLIFDTLALGINVTMEYLSISKEEESIYAPYIAKSDTWINENGHLIKVQDLDLLLYEMSKYLSENYSDNFGDVVLLLSGKRFFKRYNETTYIEREKGTGSLGGACDKFRKYGTVEISPYSILPSFILISHEIGHLLGAVHNGNGPTPKIPNSPGSRKCLICESCIMNAITYRDSKRFSICARENILNFLSLEKSSCTRSC